MKSLKSEDLEIQLVPQGENLLVNWLGKSNTRNPADVLNPFFENVLSELDGKNIIVDFTKFEYMNSSTVPPIIKLVKDLSEKKINGKIIYSKSVEWQVSSFKALSTIIMLIKGVTIESV